MSTGYECEFIEPVKGSWYYILQRWDCPVGAWDWREYANAFGPFDSFDDAQEHRRTRQANPGGFDKILFSDCRIDDVMKKLISSARK